MIYSLLDLDTQIERQQAVEAATSQFMYKGRTEEEVSQLLMEAFSAADTDGSGSLTFSAVRSCLEGCALELGSDEVMGLLSMLASDTPYSDLATYAFKVLRSIAARKA